MANLIIVNQKYDDIHVYGRLLNYILNPEKVLSGCIGSQFIYNNGIMGMACQMKDTAQYYGADTGRLLSHMVVSFDSAEEGWIDCWKALHIVAMAVCRCFSGQVVLAAHENTEHIHVHIILSNVEIHSGKKINLNKSLQVMLASNIYEQEFLIRHQIGKMFEPDYGFYGEREEIYQKVSECKILYKSEEVD